MEARQRLDLRDDRHRIRHRIDGTRPALGDLHRREDRIVFLQRLRGTVENVVHRLGFEDDERDFRLGAELLRRLGFSQVRLLTNNPKKVAMLERGGITVVERVPLSVGQTVENADYLATKAAKSGHIL